MSDELDVNVETSPPAAVGKAGETVATNVAGKAIKRARARDDAFISGTLVVPFRPMSPDLSSKCHWAACRSKIVVTGFLE